MPLSGVTVIELGLNLAGPLATQILADLGADIVKVERPMSLPLSIDGRRPEVRRRPPRLGEHNDEIL